jgi:hypothetical protein
MAFSHFGFLREYVSLTDLNAIGFHLRESAARALSTASGAPVSRRGRDVKTAARTFRSKKCHLLRLNSGLIWKQKYVPECV